MLARFHYAFLNDSPCLTDGQSGETLSFADEMSNLQEGTLPPDKIAQPLRGAHTKRFTKISWHYTRGEGTWNTILEGIYTDTCGTCIRPPCIGNCDNGLSRRAPWIGVTRNSRDVALAAGVIAGSVDENFDVQLLSTESGEHGG